MATAIFHTAFIGDIFLTIPLLKRLRATQGTEPVYLICRPGLKEFFEGTGLVTRVIELDKKDSRSVGEFNKFVQENKFEYVFCPHRSFRSAWILRKVQAKVKIGYREWWNFLFFNVRIRREMKLPEPMRLLSMLAPFDGWTRDLIKNAISDSRWHNPATLDSATVWNYKIPAEISAFVEPVNADGVIQKFALQRPYVIVAPGSRWNTKQWTNEGFVELIGRLHKRGLHVYCIGAKSEAEQISVIVKKISSGGHFECRSLAGQTTLAELHGLMSKAKSVVANDSGPMHLAAAAGVPVVGIFGPTTLSLGFRPWTDLGRVAQVEMDCRPCGKHGHNRCPIGTHACMKKLRAEEVERVVFS